ncbi:MAG: hypothetical protein KGQ47_00895 [Hyphomicrobiales bacterium]|nr:hypothetical protein [Hyphomicrobiales bacterium]
MSDAKQKSLAVKTERETSKEIISRIRKLRWAGMDDEAERLLKELKPLPTEEKAESVLPTRVETD